MKKESSLFGLTPELAKKCKKSSQPTFLPLMLATLTTDYFSSDEWVYEHKFDGERCLAIKKNGKVHLMSRNKREINHEYPELVVALLKQKADNFIIDGEIIARDKKGISDFEMLQSRINLSNPDFIKERQKLTPVSFCIFDILYCQGYDVRELPLYARKKILKKLLNYNKLLFFTKEEKGNGLTLFRMACKKDWEGLIVKRKNSTYAGVRSPLWLKFKCSSNQELVIGGFTTAQGARKDFGALLVGYYDKHGNFTYAGKVGSGFSHLTLEMLGKKMRTLEILKCPFHNYEGPTRFVHWIKPILVADFAFAQWTNAGKLRVPRYKGLRDDKKAKDVVKETPKSVARIKPHQKLESK